MSIETMLWRCQHPMGCDTEVVLPERLCAEHGGSRQTYQIFSDREGVTRYEVEVRQAPPGDCE